jgi:hypothetical protein
MSNMEAMRSEQNSLGLLEAPSHNLSGDANSRTEMSATPAQGFTRSVLARTGTALI